MKIKDKVLIVEDEQSISNFISMILTANGYDTIIVRSGEEALTMISSHCPDLIVLDLGLPDMDGLEVLKSVRKWSNLPVVVVSARTHEHDKVEALDYGADDYLVKPFGTSELLARIRTAIRHTRTALPNSQIAQSGKFTVGELTIDYDKHQVLKRGENAKLTVNEYKIVALLGKYAGKVLTYDFIIRELWGPKAKTDNQILRVNMANIRRKIEDKPGQPQYIFTEVGVGYRMREGISLGENHAPNRAFCAQCRSHAYGRARRRVQRNLRPKGLRPLGRRFILRSVSRRPSRAGRPDPSHQGWWGRYLPGDRGAARCPRRRE